MIKFLESVSSEEKHSKKYHIRSDFKSDLSADRKRNSEERKERERDMLFHTTCVNVYIQGAFQSRVSCNIETLF